MVEKTNGLHYKGENLESQCWYNDLSVKPDLDDIDSNPYSAMNLIVWLKKTEEISFL